MTQFRDNETLIQGIALMISWRDRIADDPSKRKWYEIANATLDRLLQALPHGSGIDLDPEILDIKYQGDRITMIAFRSDFHHMNDHGYYDGWTEHTVRVYPDWDGFRLVITGRNRNDIKSYLYETWDHALRLSASDIVRRSRIDGEPIDAA